VFYHGWMLDECITFVDTIIDNEKDKQRRKRDAKHKKQQSVRKR
jgi:hypothetical protein